MERITVYHNPACGNSRGALELLRARDVDFDIIEYLKEHPTRPALEKIIDLLDGGQVVIAPNGFGVLETRRLRWFGPDGRLLGTFVSSDPIRRIYQPGTGIALETRTRRAIVAGPPSWWA